MDLDELTTRFRRVHGASVRLLAALPATDRLSAPAARAVEELAEALLPPEPPQTPGDVRDPTRHMLVYAVWEETPDGGSTSRPYPMEEAAANWRRSIERGWPAEDHSNRDALEPGLTVMSEVRAMVLEALLKELALRIAPGRVVVGPIEADDSLRRFVDELARDLHRRAGGGAGLRWEPT